MGNEWEKQGSKDMAIARCPCGKGAYVQRITYYQDDYLRDHTDDTFFTSCDECSRKYVYRGEARAWLTLDKSIELDDIIKSLHKSAASLYSKLYNKYISKVCSFLRTKKALYDVLYKNRLFHLPGTIQTFYKNGMDYYLSPRMASHDINDLLKLISLTIGLEDCDSKEVNNYLLQEESKSQFLIDNSIKNSEL